MLRFTLKTLVLTCLFCTPVLAQAASQQEFVLTAYYSPLPDQCCYVKGGYQADMVLNGHGTHGADGTAVYPGMIAAPPSYAFGTRIALPGLGNFTVHDRGGAIQEWDDGAHRLDIWMGHGEEGLARALAFGMRRVTGTVYEEGDSLPEEHFDLQSIDAPIDRLKSFAVDAQHPRVGNFGETSLSVRVLQESLGKLGYFKHGVTGYFGPVTKESLTNFLTAFGLQEPTEKLTVKAAAYLQVALQRLEAKPVDGYVDAGASPREIAQAQRVLRFLGYYRGRTSGEYDDVLFSAVLRFQKEHGLAADTSSPGAGRIGPQTLAALTQAWNKKIVAERAEQIVLVHKIEDVLTERGELLQSFLGLGSGGSQVTLLQKQLADAGYFPSQEINGNFGPLTERAVLDYQLARGIIEDANDQGAGYVGPATLSKLQAEKKLHLYRLVRSEGSHVL